MAAIGAVPAQGRSQGWIVLAGGMALQPTNAEAATLDLAGSIAENERLAKEIRATAESMERELGEGGAGGGGAGAPGAQRPPEPRVARYQPHAEMPALAGGKAALVAHMRDWDYGPGGVFERQAELGGHALYHTAAEGLHHFGVCAKLGVDPAKLNNWLLAVEKCMRPARGELPPALALPSPRAVFCFARRHRSVR